MQAPSATQESQSTATIVPLTPRGICSSPLAAYAATFFVETNFLTLILSFSPGGIYEVAVIAIAYDLEPDFVAFHHIIRLLMILFVVPVILKLIKN